MSKNYQTKTAPVGTDAELVLPEAVNIAMAEIGGAVREGLLALAVATGLAGDDHDDGGVRDRAGGAEGPPPARPGRGPSRHRSGVGHPGRPAGAGAPTAGSGRRRVRGVAGGRV